LRVQGLRERHRNPRRATRKRVPDISVPVTHDNYKLDLGNVRVHAKHWDGAVGRKTVQEFVGSMDLYRSRKGVIFTTSSFSSDALEFVERIEGKKVVLIAGDELARLVIEHRVGVSVTNSYEIVDVSQDFFDEET
jgi:restriction system protein